MNTVQLIYNNTDNTVNITLANGDKLTNQPIANGWKMERELLEERTPFNVKIGWRINGEMVYA